MARIPKIEEQEHPELQALVNEIKGKRGRRISDWNHRVSPTAEMAQEDLRPARTAVPLPHVQICTLG